MSSLHLANLRSRVGPGTFSCRARADKVQALCRLNDVGVMMHNKRIWWAASVYARNVPELREIAEPILQEVLDEGLEMMWRQETKWESGVVEVVPLDRDRVEEW